MKIQLNFGSFVSLSGDADVIRYNRIVTMRNIEKRVKNLDTGEFTLADTTIEGSNLKFTFGRTIDIDGQARDLRVTCNVETESPHAQRNFSHVGGKANGQCTMNVKCGLSWLNFGLPSEIYNVYEFNDMARALRDICYSDVKVPDLLRKFTRFESVANALFVSEAAGYEDALKKVVFRTCNTILGNPNGYLGGNEGRDSNHCHTRCAKFMRHTKNLEGYVWVLVGVPGTAEKDRVSHSYILNPQKRIAADSFHGKHTSKGYVMDNVFPIVAAYAADDIKYMSTKMHLFDSIFNILPKDMLK
jgi:hypothetical protein